MKAIDQQIILVTGATDGLGKQTAHELAMQGGTVLLHGRSRKRLETTMQEIRTTTKNAKLEAYLADFSELSQVHRLAEEVRSRHDHLDLLINNVGIGVRSATSTE